MHNKGRLVDDDEVVSVMVYLTVAACVTFVGIIALQFMRVQKRKGLRLRKNRLGEGFQAEWQRYLPFVQTLRSDKEVLSPKIAEETKELGEKFSAFESLLGELDQKLDAGKLSDAESNLNDIAISLDEIEELKRSDEATPH